MRLPRFTIIDLIALVIVLAADLAWVRWFLTQGRSAFWLSPMAFDLGIVPPASVLMVTLCHFLHRRQSSPFLVGFLSSGLFALLLFVACCLLVPKTMNNAGVWAMEFINGRSDMRRISKFLQPFHQITRFDLWKIGWVTVFYSLPQGVVSVLGGLVTAWARSSSHHVK